MRKIAAVAINDLRLIFADGSIWINLVLVPVVLSLVLGFAMGASFGGNDDGTVVPLPIDVVDADRSALSRELMQAMQQANARLVICPADDTITLDPSCEAGTVLTSESVPQRLEEEQSSAYIMIPEGFGASVLAGEPIEVIYRSRESAIDASPRYAALQSAAANVGAAITARTIAAGIGAELPSFAMLDESQRDQILDGASERAEERIAMTSFNLQRVDFTVQEEEIIVPLGLAQSVPGMASMYAVIITLAMAAAFVRDRKQGVIQRALTMAVRPAELLGGKVVAYFVICLFQVSLLLGFGRLMGLQFGSNFFALATLVTAYSLAVTGLALFVTSLVTTEGQAQNIGLLVGLVMGPLGGAWWPLTIVPGWMQRVGQLTPIAWVMNGYQSLIFRDAGFAGIALPAAVLLGMALLYFALGLWRIQLREA